MSLARHFALSFLYCAAALATFLLMPAAVPGLLGQPALIAAGFVLLAGMFLHEILARRGTVRALEEEVLQLRRGWGEANHDLVRLRDEADLIRDRLQRRNEGGEVGAVVAEVKLLQSLVERLSSSRTAAPVAAPAPELASAAASPAPVAPPVAAPDRIAAPAAIGSDEKPAAVRDPARPAPTVRRDLGEAELLEALQDGLREDRVEL